MTWLIILFAAATLAILSPAIIHWIRPDHPTKPASPEFENTFDQTMNEG